MLGKVRKFHNIHKGDSCYVFGDGISIKSMDLSLFDDKVAIASNYLPLHKEFGKLDCRYCVVAAPYFFSHFFGYESIQRRHMNGMSALYRELIANNPDKNFFFNLSNYPFIGGDNLFYMFKDIPDDRLPADYISKRISCFSGVIHMSILLSIYLGFEHIYLVGFDYTHVPSRNWHWYEKGKGIFRPHEHENYNKDFFAIAKEFIDITTITLDGTSNFINAVTYKEHIGCEPVYRENTELIDERCLKALATWPSYTIY
ncbi:MAG: hypothetical protein ABW168_22185 [Sedimenticola sp.]